MNIQKALTSKLQKSIQNIQIATKPVFMQSVRPAFGRSHHQNIQKAITTKLQKFIQNIQIATKPVFMQSVRPAFGRGFTLAEVLITLGIIGVVAAITIPNLVQKYQKRQTVARLKEVYSILNQAVRLSERDNDDISNWDYQSYSNGKGVEFAEVYFNKYLKIKRINVYKFEGWKSLDGSLYSGGSGMYTKPQFVLYNGVLISFYPNYYTLHNKVKSGVWIFVDLNGVKGPNRFGRDVFVMSMFPYASFSNEKIVMGAHEQCGAGDIHRSIKNRENLLSPSGSRWCSTCSENYTGFGYACSRLIQLDGWQIKDDYPW